MAKVKSRTFAVLTSHHDTDFANLAVYILYTLKSEDGKEELKWRYQRPSWDKPVRNQVIELLVKAGLTVRFFDPEEKKWMDASERGGVEPAPGNRDGTWTTPNLEAFKKEYLRTI